MSTPPVDRTTQMEAFFSFTYTTVVARARPLASSVLVEFEHVPVRGEVVRVANVKLTAAAARALGNALIAGANALEGEAK